MNFKDIVVHHYQIQLDIFHLILEIVLNSPVLIYILMRIRRLSLWRILWIITFKIHCRRYMVIRKKVKEDKNKPSAEISRIFQKGVNYSSHPSVSTITAIIKNRKINIPKMKSNRHPKMNYKVLIQALTLLLFSPQYTNPTKISNNLVEYSQKCHKQFHK